MVAGSAHNITRANTKLLKYTQFLSFKVTQNITNNSSLAMDSSSSSDQYNREQIALRQQKRAAPIKFLIPLIYAPVLPLIRLTLRHKPVLRDRLFTGVLIGAFAHGAYLVGDLYDAESK